MAKQPKFIMFARQSNPSAQWTRIHSTKRTTNPVTLAAAQERAKSWKLAGWEVQAINVETQEAVAL